MKTELYGLFLTEITEAVLALGLEKFRGRQIAEWIYQQGAASFAEMLNIPQKQRELLSSNFTLSPARESTVLVSGNGKTAKYLLELSDAVAIETVLMRQPYGNSVCISTQAGCQMGCSFCASALGGFRRNLSAGEILSQVIYINNRLKTSGSIGNIVIMGTGEPLFNYDNVLRFIHLCHQKYCLNLSYRRITLSTCGIVPGIYRLAEAGIPITLSVSLHAPDNNIRDRLMSVNKKYPLEEVLAAGDYYAAKTGRRVTYEYILLSGVNDSLVQAEALAKLMVKRLANVNLIPLNQSAGLGFRRPADSRIGHFAAILQNKGINVTVRKEMGSDIQAACGQLRHKLLLED